MKNAADFKETALQALSGKWKTAVLTGFVAVLLGGGIASGGTSYSSNNESRNTIIAELQKTEAWQTIQSIMTIALIVIVVWTVVSIVIGGAVKLGYAKFNLNLIDCKEAGTRDLFSQFHVLNKGFWMNFLLWLYEFLWTLCFIVPGIIKGYSYAMTPYILAENPDMSADDAITESREIMDGNKWRLFCLRFSFIGWSLLCVAPSILVIAGFTQMFVNTRNILLAVWMVPCSYVPLTIGKLFLRPYIEASYAAFYRDLVKEKKDDETAENVPSQPVLED